MIILIFFLAHWFLSLFTQSFFYHRYAAHRMFTMSRRAEKWFIFLSWFFQGSSYLNVYGYGVMHRLHHAYADKEQDPHSPKYNKTIPALMWHTWLIYAGILDGTYLVEDKFLKNLPRWPWFESFASNWYVRIGWAVFYIAFYVVFATHWWMYILLFFHFVMGPLHGAIINWYAHRIGSRRFKMDNTSTNILLIGLPMLGESYHNNHHKFPNRLNFGIKWYEFDPIYPIILLFNRIHIIRIRREEIPA